MADLYPADSNFSVGAVAVIEVVFGKKYQDKKTGFIGVCVGQVLFGTGRKMAILSNGEKGDKEKSKWAYFNNLVAVGEKYEQKNP